MKPAYLQFDNLDDRREILHLLHKLAPAERVRFLAWCCGQCRPKGATYHGPSARTKGHALEIFFDVWLLAVQDGLNLDRALKKLEEVVRRKI